MNLPLWPHLLWQKIRSAANVGSKPLYRGIDVSEWNPRVNIESLKGKIDFAILRCGYGSDYTYQDDSCFAKNVQACQKAGIPYGVYLFSYAKNAEMAKSEAAHLLRLIRGTDPAFGVWYDLEGPNLPEGETLTTICKTWCEAVSSAGITCVGIYASLDLMRDYFSGPEFKKYEKWVAQWNSTCNYPDPGIWQFTSQGSINGITLDMNYAYKDYPSITGANMTQEKFNEMLGVYLEALQKKPANSWAKEAWDEACQRGLFDGTGPRSPLTREQAASVLKRLERF